MQEGRALMAGKLAAYLQEVHQPIPATHVDFGGGRLLDSTAR